MFHRHFETIRVLSGEDGWVWVEWDKVNTLYFYCRQFIIQIGIVAGRIKLKFIMNPPPQPKITHSYITDPKGSKVRVTRL